MFGEIIQLDFCALFWHDLSAASFDLPGEVGGEMSCLSCLAKRSRVKGGRRGGGRGGTRRRDPIVAETLPSQKKQRLLKWNHRYPCQRCILSHTQNSLRLNQFCSKILLFLSLLPSSGASGSSCPASMASHTVWGSRDVVLRTLGCGNRIASGWTSGDSLYFKHQSS